MQLLGSYVAVELVEQEKKEATSDSGLIIISSKDETPDLAQGKVVGVGEQVNYLSQNNMVLFKLSDAMTGLADGQGYLFLDASDVVATL